MGSELVGSGWRPLRSPTAALVPLTVLRVAGVVAMLVALGAVLLKAPSLVMIAVCTAFVIGLVWFLDTRCAAAVGRVHVSDTGVLVRGLFKSDMFAWHAVLAVRSQTIVRGNTNTVVEQARQVCVDLDDGRTIELPIQGRIRGHDSRTLWLPDLLPAHDFDHVLADLRQLAAQHQSP